MMSITIKANSLFPRVNFTTETWRKPDLSTTSYEKDLKVFFDRRLITNQSCGSNDSEVSLSNTHTHTHTHTHTRARARAHAQATSQRDSLATKLGY
jgi:ABC-type nickel/cobalt efflux system permease component RcnA